MPDMDKEKAKRIQKNYEQMRTIINDLKIEGLEFTQEELKKLEKIAREEMTSEVMWDQFCSKVEKLRKTNPEMFYQGDKK